MEYTVNLFHPNADGLIGRAVGQLLSGCNEPPVLLCIGSDKVTGDALGPLVGHLLTRRFNAPAYVYGTLEHPVTANNLGVANRFIKTYHPTAKVLAIDAALSDTREIGLIYFRNKGVQAGKALGKALPCSGDYSITAIVNTGSDSAASKLFSTSLHTVIRLAESIAAALFESIKLYA